MPPSLQIAGRRWCRAWWSSTRAASQRRWWCRWGPWGRRRHGSGGMARPPAPHSSTAALGADGLCPGPRHSPGTALAQPWHRQQGHRLGWMVLVCSSGICATSVPPAAAVLVGVQPGWGSWPCHGAAGVLQLQCHCFALLRQGRWPHHAGSLCRRRGAGTMAPSAHQGKRVLPQFFAQDLYNYLFSNKD